MFKKSIKPPCVSYGIDCSYRICILSNKYKPHNLNGPWVIGINKGNGHAHVHAAMVYTKLSNYFSLDM